MNDITPAEIKQRLHGQIESVCSHLLPGGSIKGHEYVAGGISGGNGKSLKVELRGSKVGVWSDFSSSDDKGDILDLWQKTRGINFRDAFLEACRWLGITQIDRPKKKEKPQNVDKSAASKFIQSDTVLSYLVDERRIPLAIVNRYKVCRHRRNSPFNTDFIAFPFIDSDGDLVMLKSTGIKKKPDGGKDIWSTKPYYTLWGWWTVGNNRSVIITEGEIDAMSVASLDCEIPVLSMPSGSTNLDWIENDFHALQCLERIYILTDMDAPGEEAAKNIAKRLGQSRCFRIPVPYGYKDANEAICSGDERVFTWPEWMAGCFSFDPPTLQSASAFRTQARELHNRDIKEDNDFLFPDIPFSFRPGETTIFTGYPGHGKSEFLYQVHLHEIKCNRKTCIASLEIGPAEMLNNLACQFYRRPPSQEELDGFIDWVDGRLWFYCAKNESVKGSDLMEDLKYSVKRFGCERLVIDSLHFIVEKEDYQGQDLFVRNLCLFTFNMQVHTSLVAHAKVKKGENFIPGMGDVEGSGGIVKPIDNGITVWRNVDKEDKINEAEESGDEAAARKAKEIFDGFFMVWKQRRTGDRPKRKLWFEKSARSFRTKQADAPIPVNKEDDAMPDTLF